MKPLRIPYLWLLLLPFALFHLGEWLNILVVSVNHGTMPVLIPQAVWMSDHSLYAGQMLDGVHKIMQPGDHLKWLADIFTQNHATDITSVGDQCIWLGEWIKVPAVTAWFTTIAHSHFED